VHHGHSPALAGSSGNRDRAVDRPSRDRRIGGTAGYHRHIGVADTGGVAAANDPHSARPRDRHPTDGRPLRCAANPRCEMEIHSTRRPRANPAGRRQLVDRPGESLVDDRNRETVLPRALPRRATRASSGCRLKVSSRVRGLTSSARPPIRNASKHRPPTRSGGARKGRLGLDHARPIIARSPDDETDDEAGSIAE